MIKKIGLGLLGVLIIMQFFRPEKNLGNRKGPEDITKFVSVPSEVMAILETSCYDCHSNQTNYSWYHEIMPFGWWLEHHVEEGKEHLNFSDFSQYSTAKIDHKLEETAEEVEEHEMPLSTYSIVHKDAQLSEEQTNLIINWVKEARASLKE